MQIFIVLPLSGKLSEEQFLLKKFLFNFRYLNSIFLLDSSLILETYAIETFSNFSNGCYFQEKKKYFFSNNGSKKGLQSFYSLKHEFF